MNTITEVWAVCSDGYSQLLGLKSDSYIEREIEAVKKYGARIEYRSRIVDMGDVSSFII